MPWYIFSAINVIGFATLAVSIRWALRDGKYDPSLYSIINIFYAALFFTLIGVIFGHQFDFADIPIDNLLFGAALNVGVFLYVARALAIIDVSPYTMISNLRGLFIVPLAAIFLNEVITLNLVSKSSLPYIVSITNPRKLMATALSL